LRVSQGRTSVPYGEMDVTILLLPNDIDKILEIMERNGDIAEDTTGESWPGEYSDRREVKHEISYSAAA